MADHMDFIEAVAREDIAALREKERTYRGSWKKRGGVGAFMMLARKWDRLENMLREDQHSFMDGPYDVFGAIQGYPEGQDGTVLAEVRDLRRYLLLVEAEMAARGVLRTSSTCDESSIAEMRARDGEGMAFDPGEPEYDKDGRFLRYVPRSESVRVLGVSGERRVALWSTPYLRSQLQDLGRSPPSPVGDALAARIRAELVKRGADNSGWREEPTGPGSPADGGHHWDGTGQPAPRGWSPGDQ